MPEVKADMVSVAGDFCSHIGTVSQVVPVAMSQVLRRHKRTRLNRAPYDPLRWTVEHQNCNFLPFILLCLLCNPDKTPNISRRYNKFPLKERAQKFHTDDPSLPSLVGRLKNSHWTPVSFWWGESVLHPIRSTIQNWDVTCHQCGIDLIYDHCPPSLPGFRIDGIKAISGGISGANLNKRQNLPI